MIKIQKNAVFTQTYCYAMRYIFSICLINLLNRYSFNKISPFLRKHYEKPFLQNAERVIYYFIIRYFYLFILKASNPGKIAVSPRASSILNNWLYLAILSERDAEPVLI